jgi:DNA-binding NtrC family response regulator
VKLLRFLGERTFERLGSNKTLVADVRLLAATNKNLAELVRAGTFREDLYFRLKVVDVTLPPLRERKDDIPLLVQAFMKEFARENEKPVKEIRPEAMDALLAYSWPGNVRELRTAIEHAVVLSRGDKIGLRDLPATVRGEERGMGTTGVKSILAGGTITVKEAEKELIVQALKECRGNRSEAARKLGMSRRTLHRKLHTYHLEGF